MAELVMDFDQLVLRLSWWEKIAAAHGNVRVPLSIVVSARVEANVAHYWRDPMFRIQAGGWRSLDTGYGVRGYGSGFVALRHWRRGRPAVLVYLGPPPERLRRFQALLVTVADPEGTAARITEAKHGRPGSEGTLLGQARARRLWLPWRPRLRLIWAWQWAWAFPVVAYPAAGLRWLDRWQTRTFPGWLRPIALAIFMVPYLYAWTILLALVADVTILAFGASIYLVAGEWLVLAAMFPFGLVARLTSLRPWTLIADAGTRRWTARVAGWSASVKAAANAAGALTSGAEPPEPPWSPAERRAHIWR